MGQHEQMADKLQATTEQLAEAEAALAAVRTQVSALEELQTGHGRDVAELSEQKDVLQAQVAALRQEATDAEAQSRCAQRVCALSWRACCMNMHGTCESVVADNRSPRHCPCTRFSMPTQGETACRQARHAAQDATSEAQQQAGELQRLQTEVHRASDSLHSTRAELAEAEAALLDTRAQLDARAAERIELQGALAQLSQSKAELEAAVGQLQQQQAAHAAARRACASAATQTAASPAIAALHQASQAGSACGVQCQDSGVQAGDGLHAAHSTPSRCASADPGHSGCALAGMQSRESGHSRARCSSRASDLDAEVAATREALSTARCG